MTPHRRPTRSLNWLLIAGLAFAGAAAATALDPAQWRFAQPVTAPAPGLARLDLPPETLGASRSFLEDLRLLDAAGQEVPFLIERPSPEPSLPRPPRDFRASLQDSATSILLTTGMAEPVTAITLQSPARQFLKSVRVEGSHDGQTWQEITAGRPVFRQPDGASELRITFPPAQWETLRLTIDDRRSEPVPFTGAILHLQEAPSTSRTVPVTIKAQDESPGLTRLALDLGAANLRVARIELEVTDPLFHRAVTVAVPEWIAETISEHPVAEGFIHRVAVEGGTSDQLTVNMERQVGSRELVVFIRNQDSPPLHISAVRAVVRPTRILFMNADGAPLRLLTGNAQCPPARYDVAALAKSALPGAVEASAGALEANPNFQPAETLPELAETGAPLDLKPWAFRKAVQIHAGGVQQLEVDPEVLSRASPNLADLRLTREGRQVPYVVEHTSIRRALSAELAPAPDPKQPKLSRWTLQLPYPRLPLTRLSFESASPLFEREMRLFEKVPGPNGEPGVRNLGRALWRRTPGTESAGLVITPENTPQTGLLWLETDNGDNPPVELHNARAFYKVTRLVFKATPQPAALELSYGNPDASAPRYDLGLVAGPLLTAPRQVATTTAASISKPRPEETAGMSLGKKLLFWGALAAVVASLLAVLARLLPASRP